MKKTKHPPILSEGEKLMGWVYLALEILVLPSAIALLGQNFGGFSPAVANFLYYAANALCCGMIFRNLLAQSLSRAGEQFGQLLWVCLTGFLCLLGANQITEALSKNSSKSFRLIIIRLPLSSRNLASILSYAI